MLLAMARVRVSDRFGGSHVMRALIDPGSEVSFVAEALAQRLRLPRLRAAVTIFGVGAQRTGQAKGRVCLTVASVVERFAVEVSALVLPQLTQYGGRVAGSVPSWLHLRGLTLADPDIYSADTIEVLLGADVYASFLKAGVCKGNGQTPIAQQTAFGWVLSGIAGPNETTAASSLQCTIDEGLTALVRRFWEQEQPLEPVLLTLDEQRCEDLFVSTHSRDDPGRYVVRLPFREEAGEPSALLSTRLPALQMLQ